MPIDIFISEAIACYLSPNIGHYLYRVIAQEENLLALMGF